MNKIYLYDSYQDKKLEFKSIKKNKVSLYYCGPTVYNYVHLGNFRPPIVFDNLARLFTELGYKVEAVSNYTDIDDKIIKASIEENKTEKELSSFYIEAYEQNLKDLNILPLYMHPKASEYILDMVDFIDKLIKQDSAYKKGDNIYFRTNKINNYGKLSNQNLNDLNAGSRIDVDKDKENSFDFVLWKLTKDKGIKFDTKIGLGRPGWHSECVVMVNKVFKQNKIDIHGGGFDLKFPHHENEIAQSIALNNSTLANYWMHVGFLLTNGEKMSKSLNNSTLTKDVIARHSPNSIRLFFASTHYRSPINYTEDIISSFDNIISRYSTGILKANYKLQLNDYINDEIINDDYNLALSYLCDDLNTPNLISILDKEIKEINQLCNLKSNDLKNLSRTYNTFIKLSNLIGIKFESKRITEEDKKLYFDFLDAYNNKEFDKSDPLRKILIEKGII